MECHQLMNYRSEINLATKWAAFRLQDVSGKLFLLEEKHVGLSRKSSYNFEMLATLGVPRELFFGLA